MNQLGNFVLAGLISTVFSSILSIPAFAEIILPGRCHMGQCWESKYLGKELLKENAQGKLYSVQLANRSWPINSQPSDYFSAPKTNYVYCSTRKPAYIFKLDSLENDIYYAHLLNPGGSWYGYNVSDYPVYWATCHNFVGPAFFSEMMTSRAIKLGYPLNLQSEQIELQNVLEIMD